MGAYGGFGIADGEGLEPCEDFGALFGWEEGVEDARGAVSKASKQTLDGVEYGGHCGGSWGRCSVVVSGLDRACLVGSNILESVCILNDL